MNMNTHTLTADTDPHRLLEPEWLLTNQTGGYAMGTAAGCNTRRYHGLLVAAAHPPVGRVVALNQMLEQLTLAGQDAALEFNTCQFRGGDGQPVFAPNGLAKLQTFERGLGVCWAYQTRGITLRRELQLHPNAQAITLRYTITGLTQSASLRLSPMLTLRDFHHLLQQPWAGTFDVDVSMDHVVVHHAGQAVALQCSHGSFDLEANWWNAVHYPCETQRGQDDTEDYFVPGSFVVPLKRSKRAQTFTLTASLGSEPVRPVTKAKLGKRQKRIDAMAQHIADHTPAMSSACSQLLPDEALVHQCLAIAADDFVVERKVGKRKLMTILAGYPWFADWGRDTFIALPGLLLNTGRYAEAKAVLQAFASVLHQGLIPNRFDDYDAQAAHYNTVDASLWFVHAALCYVQAVGETNDDWLVNAVMQVLDYYETGTMNNTHMDPADGLISAGTPGTQLTWMDAKCGDVVFTPRDGKAVEINALWYSNLLGVATLVEAAHPDRAAHYRSVARRVKKHYRATFERPDGRGLFDHVRPDGCKDASIRPNQVFAVSLPHSPLPTKLQKQVVQTVKEQLLTPVGLATLPTDDPNYHPWYGGNGFQRDEAYHQGTIWPWLIGGYAEAVMRVGKFSPTSRRHALETITPLMERLLGDGVGQLHEIHEAATHRPAGSPAQAWSVAEVLRIYSLARSG